MTGCAYKEQTMEHIVILGLGNILYGDEGFGVRAAERLYADWEFPDHVEVVDGGTQGHTLLTFVEEADRLLILDAVDFGQAPGTLTQREDEDIPAWLCGRKISPHQNSFSEVLALAQLRGRLPAHMVLIGVHPAAMELGGALSPLADGQVNAAVELTLRQLRLGGVDAQPAAVPRRLHHSSLD